MSYDDSLYYPSLDAYNADIAAAREAYARDLLVADGYCENDDGRKRDIGNRSRKCRACQGKS